MGTRASLGCGVAVVPTVLQKAVGTTALEFVHLDLTDIQLWKLQVLPEGAGKLTGGASHRIPDP